MQKPKMKMMNISIKLLFVLNLVHQLQTSSPSNLSGPQALALKALGPQGIVVPKRSALISGLNNQFKPKQTQNKTQNVAASNQPQLALETSKVPQQSASIFSPSFNWLGARITGVSAQNGQKSSKFQQQQQQTLYLDRHQQEILAANPNLLNPPANSLFTRSDHDQLIGSANGNASFTGQPERISNSQSSNEQQLYKGYSLIELDVKSEADRRYIEDLYGNLTLAINEQAQNPNAVSVSPYVDVDFWSFRYAINDQLDIMVSPKSKTFILNQLNKAKIRHRIKIDDIQSKLLDGQQVQTSVSSQTVDLSATAKSADGLSSNAMLSGRQSSLGSSQSGAGNLNARQADSQQQLRPMNESLFFDNYQRLTDINAFLEQILDKNRDVAQVKVIGRSSQGRYLRVLKLGYDQTDSDGSTSISNDQRSATGGSPGNTLDPSKPPMAATNASYILDTFFRKQESATKLGSIWLDGGTHAREWISPATTLYIAHRLADNHYKCRKFFETLKLVVSQANQLYASQQMRSAKNYNNLLDPELILGINEINSSLLGGKPLKQIRPRTELEHTLELLAKQPQDVATEYQCDLETEQLLRRYTFYIMPVLNPDGYEYSHTHNRLWRKTRSTSNHPIYRHFCLGADPNRNYDARHGSTGSSTHPCSQTYAGNVPFTEPETRHQSNFVYANRIGMKMFISFHSYSQMILLPYSHSVQLAPDHKDLDLVGQAAVKAIEKTHGTVYRVGPSASILYTASGTASDWAYEKAGIKYSYTMELRDTGAYGFLLPKQQIVPTGEETFNGLLAMIQQMEKNERLLTSKSMLVDGNTMSILDDSMECNSLNASDYLHVPSDLDNHLFTKNRKKSTLENVLKRVNQPTASDMQPITSGVRDRISTSELALLGQDNLNDAIVRPQVDVFGSPYEPEPVNHDITAHRFGEENVHDDNEPDSGYVFEGEGELMEPTRENILEASKISAEASLRLMSGRQDHSRRIVQSAGITASGRNLINSPLTSMRLTNTDLNTIMASRRESSDDIASKNGEYVAIRRRRSSQATLQDVS